MALPFWDSSLSTSVSFALVGAMALALAFEFVNGFHDTANAVATVIYTRSLDPRKAVVWSGFCNFLGVYLGGTAVAFSIVNLLPVDLLVSGDHGAALAMVMALLTAAIAWNVGTWALAIPASSSHTLIGAILGVGLANAALNGRPAGSGVDWHKAGEVGLSLLLSPLVGFVCAGILLLMLRRVASHPRLHEPAHPTEPPPIWVRGTLLATCTGVSLAHGSNDGQKGIGLVMLILIGLVPAQFALNPTHDAAEVRRMITADDTLHGLVNKYVAEAERADVLAGLDSARATLAPLKSLRDVPRDARWRLRADLIVVDKALGRLLKSPPAGMTDADRTQIRDARAALASAINFAPTWVLLSVATALGVGTMFGWKRIVVTVGEKIGKAHLSYAQGAAAELVAAGTIGLADLGGLPVSTTQVLSSGVAGTMAASKAGVQLGTVRNIALAWVLTVPVSMLLSALLFTIFRSFV